MPLTTVEALDFLERHQPFPYDSEFTPELDRQLAEVIDYFRSVRDDRCVRPFVFSMGVGGGTGRFREIGDLVSSYPKDVVIPVLQDAMRSSNNGTQFQALFIADEINDRRLLRDIRAALHSPDEHVRIAATAPLQRTAVRSDRLWLQQEADAAEGEIAEFLKEILEKISAEEVDE